MHLFTKDNRPIAKGFKDSILLIGHTDPSFITRVYFSHILTASKSYLAQVPFHAVMIKLGNHNTRQLQETIVRFL